MHQDGLQILELLFNPKDRIVCSPDKFSYHSFPLENIELGQVELISPNPSVPVKSVNTDDLILVCLNPLKEGVRNDQNIASFRNFLIEMDISDQKSQIEYLKRAGLPYSAMVWSGNKSVHTLIALEQSLPSLKAYKTIAQWILNILPLTDQNMTTPSKCLRVPGAIRPDTGKVQQLLELNRRISLKELADWLNKHPSSKPKEHKKRQMAGEADISAVRPWAALMLKEAKAGFPGGQGRNHSWFVLAAEFANAGFSEDKTIEIFQQFFEEDHDFKEKEFLTSIASAFKFIANKA
jgi:hypothetical protein